MMMLITLIFISVFWFEKSISVPLNQSQAWLHIAGGDKASIKDFPYQVALDVDGDICGGFIVNARHVVTAAHCTWGKSVISIAVRAGSNTRDSDGVLISASAVTEHPHFDPDSYDNDVAVIKLKADLNFDDSVNMIALAPADYTIEDGRLATVTGYGYVSDHGPLSDSLRKVDLPLITTSGCQYIYGVEEITDNMFCAGYAEGVKDACQGDSGGPLVIDGKVIGIVSFGPDCASPGMPGVYTKVSKMRSFIDPIINS